MYHVAGWPAAGADPSHAFKAKQDLAFCRQEVVALGCTARRCDLVRYPQLLKYPHDLVIDVRGARQRIDVRRFVDHQYPHATSSQKQAQRYAGGAAAYDENVAINWHIHGLG